MFELFEMVKSSLEMSKILDFECPKQGIFLMKSKRKMNWGKSHSHKQQEVFKVKAL